MRIRLEKEGETFELERRPMPEHRFRTLCLLGAAGIYAGMVVAVAALCGIWGIAAIAVATLLSVAVANV